MLRRSTQGLHTGVHTDVASKGLLSARFVSSAYSCGCPEPLSAAPTFTRTRQTFFSAFDGSRCPPSGHSCICRFLFHTSSPAFFSFGSLSMSCLPQLLSDSRPCFVFPNKTIARLQEVIYHNTCSFFTGQFYIGCISQSL